MQSAHRACKPSAPCTFSASPVSAVLPALGWQGEGGQVGHSGPTSGPSSPWDPVLPAQTELKTKDQLNLTSDPVA